MSTQFLGKTFDDEAKALLYQSGIRVYFKPDDINLKSIAMNIGRYDYKEWMKVLKNLDKGECVFCGKTQNTVQYKGKVFCSNCWGEINSLKILTKRED